MDSLNKRKSFRSLQYQTVVVSLSTVELFIERTYFVITK